MTLYSGRSFKPPPERLIKEHKVIPEEVSLACQLDLKRESRKTSHVATFSPTGFKEKFEETMHFRSENSPIAIPPEPHSPGNGIDKPGDSILIQDNMSRNGIRVESDYENTRLLDKKESSKLHKIQIPILNIQNQVAHNSPAIAET